jgi:cGMP-dependent protein kinase
MKVMKKQQIVELGQQTHVFNERQILFESKSDFIVKLYKTFKDDKYLYLILEACLGGDFFVVMKKKSVYTY